MTAHPFREASPGDLIRCAADDCRKHIGEIALVEMDLAGKTCYFCSVVCSSVYLIAREVEAERARMREAALATTTADYGLPVERAHAPGGLARTGSRMRRAAFAAEHGFYRRDLLIALAASLAFIAVCIWAAITGGAA